MKINLKRIFSKRAIIIVLVVLTIISVLNTYLILEFTSTSTKTNVVDYDFVLSQDEGIYKLKNTQNGKLTEQSYSASLAINTALTQGRSVYLNSGTYILTEDIEINNKQNPKIVGNSAIIYGNGHKIIIYGDDYTSSQYALISGLTIINATIRVQNSFATTITNIRFINSTTGIEFINTNTWSEYNKIENCQFFNNTEGIAFRTPIGLNATGSYASSIIERCSFNIKDFSVGINVEYLAEFSDSQLQNIRFWMGECGRANQTGLLVDGSMCQSQLFGVVFESFTDKPVYMFGVDLGETCESAPLLNSGVSFLGNWTARIHNPFGVWVAGVGSIFERENIDIPVGLNNQYGQCINVDVQPLNINSFKPQIKVNGNFKTEETITVRIRIEYIDNVISEAVVRTFTSSETVWLSNEEIMRLFPSHSIIWTILVDSKTSLANSDVTVKVGGYGSAG